MVISNIPMGKKSGRSLSHAASSNMYEGPSLAPRDVFVQIHREPGSISSFKEDLISL